MACVVTSQGHNSLPSQICTKFSQTLGIFVLLWEFVYHTIHNLPFQRGAWWWNLHVWSYHSLGLYGKNPCDNHCPVNFQHLWCRVILFLLRCHCGLIFQLCCSQIKQLVISSWAQRKHLSFQQVEPYQPGVKYTVYYPAAANIVQIMHKTSTTV